MLCILPEIYLYVDFLEIKVQTPGSIYPPNHLFSHHIYIQESLIENLNVAVF